MAEQVENSDSSTVSSFGDEWQRFDQSSLPAAEAEAIFEAYFSEFPWARIGLNSVGFDMGCGSGRWAKFVAPRVGKLHCIDPSAALAVAKRLLRAHENVEFHSDSLDSVELESASQDFGYSLGVLHHVPDTQAAILRCAQLLKPGAPLLLYLYYAFDNRPFSYRLLWRLSDLGRRLIHRLPRSIKNVVCEGIALTVYWPLARLAGIASSMKVNAVHFPLYAYRMSSLYTMRTDARDRFGTPLEQRFTREQIAAMMENAGFEKIRFSSGPPYWCVVGFKSETRRSKTNNA